MNRAIRSILAELAQREGDNLQPTAASILGQESKTKKRRSEKRRPAREREIIARAYAREATAQVRRQVMARAQGRCEFCNFHNPLSMHHLLSGPDRKAKEAPDTCAAVCRTCHDLWHKSDPATMSAASLWALELPATPEVIADARKRADKAWGRRPVEAA